MTDDPIQILREAGIDCPEEAENYQLGEDRSDYSDEWNAGYEAARDLADDMALALARVAAHWKDAADTRAARVARLREFLDRSYVRNCIVDCADDDVPLFEACGLTASGDASLDDIDIGVIPTLDGYLIRKLRPTNEAVLDARWEARDE